MMFILFGAVLGWWVAGFRGLLVGVVMGYLLGRLRRSEPQRRLDAEDVGALFVDVTFEVMGALCKADGVVTRDEIHAVEHAFSRLQLSEPERSAAREAFSRGKAPDFDLDNAVARFAERAGGNVLLFELFLQLQLTAVLADGQLHPAEREMLVRIARGLGLSEFHIAQLEALLRAATADQSGAEQSGAEQSGAEQPGAARSKRPVSRDRLKDAYTALGVSAETAPADIKRAYRKLISETHPDKLSAQGVPQNLRELAEVRTREINAAYDVIKRARNFT
jgi:DnaJ like chaperone protein